ncbi:MAG: hypothetical protein CO093_09920 [Alphaproteobacteria bacterium CG_4_9_14_3_um_filter_47_13]|nr:MAG: hypothetical protein CO093_09920 [Alphaproteobacteria bacterium CG_4_9_14_3_um_filter_47_13]
MRKLLLGTAAVALGMTFAADQANAQVKLGLSGHTKLYTSWLDQDTASDDLDTVAAVPATAATVETESERSFDILRETEIHFTGETTLDNGLTVGAHMEVNLDGADSSDGVAGVNTEEAYAYFSGAWGRVNLGMEEGATFLLQVAAPSADSNFDGIRQFVDPVNAGILAAPATSGASTIDNVSLDDLFTGGSAAALNGMVVNTVIVDADGTDTATAGDIRMGVNGVGLTAGSRFDYDHSMTAWSDKITYMTPVFNGFQAGFSYTPEITGPNDLANNDDDGAIPAAATAITRQYGDVWDVAARYEGMIGDLGIALGAGYSHAELEYDNDIPVFYNDVDGVAGFTAGTDTVVATFDDRESWNVGVDFDWKAFGLGAAYLEDDNGVSGDHFETETWVVGADYTTGPFKIGASYLNNNQNVASADIDVERWTGGVVYTYGPGMTFRGSVSYIDHEESVGFAGSSADATSVLLGTQINF